MASHPSSSTARRRMPHVLACALWLCSAAGLSGCSVIAVADAAVTVGATAVKAGATVVGAAVDVAGAGVRMATRDNEKEE